MLFVEFTGSTTKRLRSYLIMFGVGLVFITIGTLCTVNSVLAVSAMLVVGFGVLFAGIAAPGIATAGTAVLLTFVLPICVPAPASQIPYRLAGLAIAAALSIPAVIWWWPRPWHDQLRAQAGQTADAIAAVAESYAHGLLETEVQQQALDAIAALRARFDATVYPPTGSGAGDVALARFITRLGWVGSSMATDHEVGERALARSEVREIYARVGEVLRILAHFVSEFDPHSARGRHIERQLGTAVDQLQLARIDGNAAAVVRDTAAEDADAALGLDDPDAVLRAAGADRAASVLDVIDPGFHSRALAFTTEVLATAALGADTDDTPARDDLTVTQRLGLLAEAEHAAPTATRFERAIARAKPRIRAHLNLHSVWFRNALRGAVGLALAVLVVRVTDVEHGFWVVLGTLSVLRSNALGTGATALRALGGTVVGFVIGTLLLIPFGTNTTALWIVLPFAVLLSAIAPAMISFAAGQAGFTVTVIVLFNIISPVGWRVGLTRIEDVVIGCLVSVVVGALFWPRGALAALGRALSEAYAEGSAYFVSAVASLTQGGPGAALAPECSRAIAAHHRLDDAMRQFLAERGAKTIPLAKVSGLVIGASRLRLAGHTMALLPVVPIEGHEPGSDTFEVAVATLNQACQEARDWYGELAATLGGTSPQPAPPPQHATDLHRSLVAAYEEARHHDRPGQVRTVLRMLWADQDLEDQLDHQAQVAESATTLAEHSGRFMV